VLKSTKGREKKEIILYLAGPEDLDRKIAIKKGVPEHNLIAVENDPKTVKILRGRGVNVIEGDLRKVVQNWSREKRLCAIVADFCCGIDKLSKDVFEVMRIKSTTVDAVLAINLQRGRDAISNNYRDLSDCKEHALGTQKPVLSKDGFINYKVTSCEELDGKVKNIFMHVKKQAMHEILSYLSKNKSKKIPKKHRGVWYLHMVIVGWALSALCEDPPWVDKPIMDRLLHLMPGQLRPKIFSYKSNHVYMDSLIIQWPKGMSLGEDSHPEDARLFNSAPGNLAIQRKISAALAVRTRRICGI
jgi:hypothetical protein